MISVKSSIPDFMIIALGPQTMFQAIFAVRYLVTAGQATILLPAWVAKQGWQRQFVVPFPRVAQADEKKIKLFFARKPGF